MGTLNPAQFTSELTHILTAISTPLFLHLSENDLNGTTFADWFLNGFPQDTYDSIVGFGLEDVLNALYSFPMIGNGLVQFPPEKVRTFVEEFLSPNFEDDPGDKESEKEPESSPTVPA